jgi:uncharacterized protein
LIPVRSVFWKRSDEYSLEYCTLSKDEKSWQLSGTLILIARDEPLKVDYSATCDTHWETREAEVSVSRREGSARTMKIRVDLSRRWWVQGREQGELRDCVDLDIGLTPSTNTIPIRRLNLAVGESKELGVSWIKFPEFRADRARQKYTRVTEKEYKYESGTFAANLLVDDLGLVVSYGNIWTRC